MTWSTSDLAAIKTAIQADTTASGYVSGGNPGACADYLNEVPSTSPTVIWMPAVPVAVLLTGVVWSAFIALAAGAQAAWQALTAGGTVDATNANVRAGFVDIFGSGSQTVTNLTALAQRPASRLEALFTASGVCSQYGAQVSAADVQQAMA